MVPFQQRKPEGQPDESRWVPIFPELHPYLEEAFERAEEGAEFVLPRKVSAKNLRKRFLKIINRAGLTPWPKPFQNLRSTRETELAAEYPLHVVTAWIGNTINVAMQSYLQLTLTEDYFQRRCKIRCSGAAKSGAARHRTISHPIAGIVRSAYGLRACAG